MIPYFEYHVIPLGPLNIQVWGLMVSVGIALGAWVAVREARRRGLNGDLLFDMLAWAIVCGLIASRLVHAYVYDTAAYLADPLKIFRVWEGGFSSIGWIFGGIFGSWWFARRAKLAWRTYMDAACYALPLGYGCGRIGCFLIHDHPGTLSQSPLAVQFPGGARLDHGLLLALTGFGIFGLFWLLHRRPSALTRAGYAPLLMVCYGCVRFALDFFRATDLPGADARYLGLTPAQYGCIILFAWGAWLLARRPRSDHGQGVSGIQA